MKNQKIDCFLNLNETLLAPQISFDIKALNAPETGKALLNEVILEESELSKQFFSLLLLRSFQPLNSSIEAHASAAKDLAESQVNALLGDVSQEYDLNFSSVVENLSDNYTLQNSDNGKVITLNSSTTKNITVPYGKRCNVFSIICPSVYICACCFFKKRG